MSFSLPMDLSGITPSKGIPGVRLDEGAYKVLITTVEQKLKKAPKVGNNIVFSVEVAEGPSKGTKRTMYLGIPNGDEVESTQKFLRGNFLTALLSIGANQSDVSGPVTMNDALFTGRAAFMYVAIKADDEGKDQENCSFIAPAEYEVNRADRKAHAAPVNGAAKGISIAAPPTVAAPGGRDLASLLQRN
jgi:hypothetical protein